MIALISFLALVAIFLTAARVASVALEATGMARDSAEFQARSALLGVGFTTSEAEDITRHPTRRRIVLWLMTFGNAGIITGIGSFILTFGGSGTTRQTVERSGVLVVGLVLMLLSVHTRTANVVIDSATRYILSRFTALDTRDFAALLRFEADYTVSEFHAHADEWMVDHRLADLQLTQEGVLVLGIHRASGLFIGAPTGDTTIHVGDLILAYGRTAVLRELAGRTVDEGDKAHADAVHQHRRLLRRQADDTD
ncbi:MAG: TrkA C-terminal domain-containing protein [Acidimicrobiales bacterium]